MTNIVSAVILCRSAKDPNGRSRAAQEEYCRSVCDENGWDVAEVISVEGTGAEAIERLSGILRDVDVLVAWDASRISRKTSELERVADMCSTWGVVLSLGGAVSADGLPLLRSVREQ